MFRTGRDQYTGLDRFGRVVEQLWYTLAPGVPSTGVTVFDVQYGYDANGNVLWRNDRVNSSFSELYTYDTLNQLATFARGTLNGTKTGISGTPGRTQSWDYDALGNWNGVTTDGSTETRSSNAQNEYTSISGATTPAYDANGNMTTDETGKQFVYDAWNRLVAVKNLSGTTLETFSYDGQNHRVTNTVGSTTTNLYYSTGWQVLEEQSGGVYTTRYVWSPVYVDAMVSRDTDTSGTGLTATGASYQRLWPTQDANWNVTALVDGSGSVVERYAYDPYGAAAVLSPSYGAVRTSSLYAETYLFQGRPSDSISSEYDFRERWYSALLGRFTSLDPIRFEGGNVDLYGYNDNDPISLNDPFGLAPQTKSKQFAGGKADFTYETYDTSNADLAFLVGHVSVRFGSQGDLVLPRKQAEFMVAEAMKINPKAAAGVAKYVGMSVSFSATLDCGEDPKDYEWVQRWKRSYTAGVAFGKGKVPPSLDFPKDWQLDREFGKGVLSFTDRPGFATALKEININRDIAVNPMTGEHTIKRPDLTAMEQTHLATLFNNKVTVRFEFETTLKKKGAAVAQFKWGFDVNSAAAFPKGQRTYSAVVRPHEVM